MGIRVVKNKRGWLVTLCAFLLAIPTTGILSSFGVVFVKLQDDYEISDLLVGWIGSLAFGVMFMASSLSTGLFKRFGHRTVILVGVTLCILGLLLSSFVPNPVYLFATYSLMFGFGANFIDTTTLNLVLQYFPRKNSARASCLATLGWSVGSLAMNPLMVFLCNTFGWRNGFRILSGAVALVGYSAATTFRPPLVSDFEKPAEKTKEKRRLYTIFIKRSWLMNNSRKSSRASTVSQQSAKDYLATLREVVKAPGILLWCLGNCLLNLSLVFPFINLMKFMEILLIPQKQGALVLVVLSIGDLLGRGFSSLIGDTLPFRTIHLFPIFSVGISINIFILLVVTKLPGMIGFALAIGILSGMVHSIVFKVTLDLFGNALMAEAWTLLSFSCGIGFMGGPVIAGAIFDATGSFSWSFYIGGGLVLLATLFFVGIPFWQKFKNWVPKKRTSSERESLITSEPTEIVECLLTTV